MVLDRDTFITARSVYLKTEDSMLLNTRLGTIK